MGAGRPLGPNRANDTLTRAVIDALDATGHPMFAIEKRAGVAHLTTSRMRRGLTVRASTLAFLLGAAGLEFRIVKPRQHRKTEKAGS